MDLGMKGRDFLALADFSKAEIEKLLRLAIDLKVKQRHRIPHRFLDGRVLALIFEKPSTRTRGSFQAGISHLGAESYYMRPDEMQLARGEPIKDTARVLDRYFDGLVLRTFGQDRLEEFAKWMTHPVVNALSDLTHPCQALADLLTIREKKGRLDGLKIAYAGDIWNVCHSLMVACATFGSNLYVARPRGYDPAPSILKEAERRAAASGSMLVFTEKLEDAVKNADVVYANTWHSMGGPEKEREKRIRDFMPFQVNMEAMHLAKRDAIFMHCLPGYRGEDMTDDVIEGPQSVVFDQAENRLHTEKAVLAAVIP